MTKIESHLTFIGNVAVQGIIPDRCTILELDTYHTLMMNRVTFVDGLHIILMINFFIESLRIELKKIYPKIGH